MLSIPEIQSIYGFHYSLLANGLQHINDQIVEIYSYEYYSEVQMSRLAKITEILYEVDHDLSHISEESELKRLRIISYECEIKTICIEYFNEMDNSKEIDLESKLRPFVDGYRIWMFDTTFLRDTEILQKNYSGEYSERININNDEFCAIFDDLPHDCKPEDLLTKSVEICVQNVEKVHRIANEHYTIVTDYIEHILKKVDDSNQSYISDMKFLIANWKIRDFIKIKRYLFDKFCTQL